MESMGGAKQTSFSRNTTEMSGSPTIPEDKQAFNKDAPQFMPRHTLPVQ